MSDMVKLLVTKSQREDILWALRKWIEDTPDMRKRSKKCLEELIEKIDCAGSEEKLICPICKTEIKTSEKMAIITDVTGKGKWCHADCLKKKLNFDGIDEYIQLDEEYEDANK